ncbi:MAG: FdhF/YdeP family oxidoreductase [Dehalococcoidia bacterium]|nr:FdhF/YdeP family oxidoreductase [Dehalococcoidia bacterium]
MKAPKTAGGWPAVWYTLKATRRAGGPLRLWRALRSRNTCRTCALGMGGQRGGMVNEAGRFPEVCKKSIQALASDMRAPVSPDFLRRHPIEILRNYSSRELESLGRLAEPLYASADGTHLEPVPWEWALERVAQRMRATDPNEAFFYVSGRSSNEAGFLLQLLARVNGTNNVSNCSYYCHQASGVGLTAALGSGTATVTLEDVENCDLFFLIGGNPASNHPRLMRYLVELRRRGGKVVVVNPLREVGLTNFSVPSDVRSLLRGSEIASLYLQPHIGGDVAALLGIAKAVDEMGGSDSDFLRDHTESADDYLTQVRTAEWAEIEARSGLARAEMEEAARIYSASARAIFGWTMGITHHLHGVDNVRAIADLVLLRGMAGRPGAGLLPIRGHSNVQGIGSVGVSPALKESVLSALDEKLGVRAPGSKGLDTMATMRAAGDGRLRVGFCLGGNLYAANPDSAFAERALAEVDTMVYLSTALNLGHLRGQGKETIILPVLARDEESEATTQESMFNYVRLSDGGKARYAGPRSEVAVIADVAASVVGADSPVDFEGMRAHQNIRRAIAAVIPGYAEIAEIDASKKEFHVGGRIFRDAVFGTASGRAAFEPVAMPDLALDADQLRLMTVRSEGQFNTVVYENEDIYRGQERRDIIMVSRADRGRLGLRIDEPVAVVSATGRLEPVLVREIDIRPGNAAMYYPEANVIVSAEVDPKSGTPAFKSTLVRIEPLAGVPLENSATAGVAEPA